MIFASFTGPGRRSLTDVSMSWPSARELFEILTLQGGYNATIVTLGAALLGVAAGSIGVFALLRKRSLLSDALSHATLPGIAGAFILGSLFGMDARSLPVLLAGAAVSGAIGAVVVHLIVRHSRLREDAAIGAVLSVFFGIGVVLLSVVQNMEVGNQGGLAGFILGQTAALSPQDVRLLGAVAIAALIAGALLFKEFRITCFDPAFAASQGLPVGLFDLLLMAMVLVVVVIGIQAVGIILVVAMVVIPAASARFWTERMSVMFALASVIGGLSGYFGACASAIAPRMPAGAVIVLTGGGFFVLSLLLAPRRGVVGRASRRIHLVLDVNAQHLLRAIYEAVEARPRERAAPTAPHAVQIPIDQLLHAREWSRTGLRALIALHRWRGLLTKSDDAVALTARGRREALRVTRNHRLWEEYLITHASVATSHVDRSADLVEHVLSPDLVSELERSLAARGRLPRADAAAEPAPPPSVHPIESPREQPSPEDGP